MTRLVDLNKFDTLPKLFRYQAGRFDKQVALREKNLGVWENISWKQYYSKVRIFSMGLSALGLQAKDRICIHSENRPEWLYADLASQVLQAIPVGIYPTNPAKQVKYIVGHSKARFTVTEDQEQTDKILEVKHGLPDLDKIIVIDMKGMRYYDDPQLISYKDVEAMGQKLYKQQPNLFEELVDETKTEDQAVIIYTSGTTGPPKGAILTHKNIVSEIESMKAAFPANEHDSVVSYLPLCHVAERSFSLFYPLFYGYVVNFVERIETVEENLWEISPTIFFAVPRIWEKHLTSIYIRMSKATRLKRWTFSMCRRLALKVTDNKAPKEYGLLQRAALGFCRTLVFRAILNHLGLLRCRIALSASAPISPKIFTEFRIMGLDIGEGYGLSESCGIFCMTEPGEAGRGTVGQTFPGIEVKTAEDGEILARGPTIFKGYFRDEEASHKALAGGWLHTGDIGEISEDGAVKITDRKKDIIITSGGKNIAPSEMENELKLSPFIREAMVIGDRRKFPSALIEIEFDTVAEWAQEKNIPFTTFKSLAKNREAYELIEKEVEKANRSFAQVEKVKKFAVLTKELDHDDDELTATRKVRRKVMEQKYKGLIDSLYRE